MVDEARSTMFKPFPPPLHVILSNVFPSSISPKNTFSKGLQSTSPLVQHCTATALVKCLIKYDQILATFRDVIGRLEEVEGEGQWSQRLREVEREARRRVPEFQVIVSFTQNSGRGTPATVKEDKRPQEQQEPNETRTALLSEISHRLLWMYHRSFPALVAEARFDVGKLLPGSGLIQEDRGPVLSTDGKDSEDPDDEQEAMDASDEEGKVEDEDEDEDEEENEENNFMDVDMEEAENGEQEEDAAEQEVPHEKSQQLKLVNQLHVLRLLKESEQFVWSSKSGTSFVRSPRTEN
jgi:nucleolar pre-ribosomal-associated protein 1